ncbi:hypothetical protein [Leptospira idonii]|uniref:Lipoprotein n=1 Tax=Leptospira idonii TaxID=1193500 RepID=A0A4R9LZI1_9LEPT|nr:hypothetical protein [Leptospira idonii]TGN17570.1 hypothetical protein EHS15_16155 [Leptospira idonii]
MKKQTFFSLLALILFAANCAEFGKKKKDNDDLNSLLLVAAGAAGCPAEQSVSASPTVGRKFNLVPCSGDAVSALSVLGFNASNVAFAGGVIGTSDSSTILSKGSFNALDGREKTTIEVTYSINSVSGYLDVVMRSNSVNGAAFHITTTKVQTKAPNTGATADFTKTTNFALTSFTDNTLCLEMHKEGAGLHVLGWKTACASVNRAVPDFEEEDFGSNTGAQIGFRLSGATLKSFTAYDVVGTVTSFQ